MAGHAMFKTWPKVDNKNRGHRPRFLSSLRLEGHVFNIAWRAMIKIYFIACWWPFCHAVTSTKCPRALGTVTWPWNAYPSNSAFSIISLTTIYVP